MEVAFTEYKPLNLLLNLHLSRTLKCINEFKITIFCFLSNHSVQYVFKKGCTKIIEVVLLSSH